MKKDLTTEMQVRKLATVIFLLFSFMWFAISNLAAQQKPFSEGEEKIPSAGTGFIENKGQFVDNHHKPVDHILFKLPGNGLDIYVTTSGLNYVFYRIKEEENHEQKQREKDYKKANNIEWRREEGVKEEMNSKIEWNRMDMLLEGAEIKKENIVASQPEPGERNYFFHFCPDGILHVKSYQKISIKNIYPGIDWVLYSSPEKGLKHEFIVNPGADPAQIKMTYKGFGDAQLNNEKNKIHISTSLGKITEGELDVFSEDGKKVEASIRQTETETKTFGFTVGEYNKNQNLVIDPPLVWSTYYGGGVLDGTRNVITDQAGNVFVVGYATSTNTPTVNPGSGAYYQGTSGTLGSALIMKFSPAGAPLWVTYYGGSSNYSNAKAMCLDAAGDLYVVGETGANNFPTYDPGNGAFFQGVNNTAPGNIVEDIFILRFSNTGVRKWATYFGGDMQELAEACIIDGNGNLLITGTTNSTSLYPLLNPGGGTYYQGTNGGGFDMVLARFNTSNNSLAWSTFYGGNNGERGQGFDKDASGNILMVGHTGSNSGMFTLNPGGGAFFQGNFSGGFADLFFIKMTSTGIIQWATYYGGNSIDYGFSIKTESCGSGFYVMGQTNSLNFPLVNPGGGAYFQGTYGGGVSDMFMMKFNSSLALTWCTFLGGDNSETAFGTLNCNRLTTDNNGNVYAVGGTFSSNWPTVNPGGGSYYQSAFGGVMDIFICRFNSSGTMTWSTYFGGPNGESATGIFMDPTGSLYIAGEYTGAGAITANPGGGAYNGSYGGSDDIGIAKFAGTNSVMTISTVVNDISCFGANDGSAIITVNGGVQPYTFQWNTGQNNDTVTGLAAGTYTIVISDSDTAGCSSQGNQQTVNITINEPPAIVINTIQTDIVCSAQCIGEATVNATGGTGGFTYQWSPGGQSSSSLTGLCAGSYTVSATDNSGCSDTAIVTINQTTGTLSFTPASSPVSCFGGNDGSAGITISGGSGTYTYNWSPGGQTTSNLSNLAAGNYTVTATDTNGCSATVTIEVTEPSQLLVTATGPVSACSGQPVTVSSMASGGTGTFSYFWSNGSSFPSFTFTPSASGIFVVTVTDANGCTDSDTSLVTVNPLPQLVFSPSDTSSCNEICIQLSVSSTVPLADYQWNFGDGQTSFDATPFHCYSSVGTYNVSVNVTDVNGCTGNTFVPALVTIYPSPSANLLVSNIELSDFNPFTTLTNASSGSTGGMIFTADNLPGQNLLPGHSTTAGYSDTGAFLITLVAWNDFGCYDTTYQTVQIIPEHAIYVPNTFTPDGDGLNDIFAAKGINITAFEMYIFNRWGELIFISESIDNGWNGIPKGGTEIAQIDTYVYKIEYKDYKGYPHSFIGHVNLVR